MKKKIVFFDADGTIWYPSKTKRDRHPVWMYYDKRYKGHKKHLMMIPGAILTLKKLKKMGIVIIILSTSPHPKKEADAIIQEKIEHFNIKGLLDEVLTTRNYPESKGEFIEQILKERNLNKSDALMVGDSYKWDYLSATNVGVDALLIETPYEENVSKAEKTIKDLKEVLKDIT